MILYTYSLDVEPNEGRWKDPGTPGFFFAELDEVRQAVIELRREVTSNGDDEPSWSAVRIERIEILAPTAQSVLTLLNDGIGPLIQRYEIVETIA
ncbi:MULTISPECIES: hypothetical protein [unclassified Mesorhizobium]|uniref:hypothetical protein n=1 Tax=unclassified Mesorhizobium TaxID=325217 RepID=UPI003339BB2B